MGWDMGPPIWPYRAVFLFSYAVNAPAYVISWPILRLLELRTFWLQFAVWFPAIVIWWWWVGTCIDFGLLDRRSYARRPLKTGILFAASLVFLLIATWIGCDEYLWVRDYWQGHPPIYAILFLRTVGPMAWCLFLAGACFLAAIHLVRHKSPPSSFNPNGYLAFLFCTAILGLNATGIAYVDRVLNPVPDANSCEIDRLNRLGCVHGMVTDESEKPVVHIEVDLIPTFKSGEARRLQTGSQWTDKQGRYNFNFIGAGEYLLAVNPCDSSPGPDQERPFETRYYRQADSESSAERVSVIQSSPNNLPPLRLRHSKFTTIEVSVEWEDGSRPKRSDVFVQNTRYWGLLGGLAEIENGVGKVDLAQGFEYVANGQVECAGLRGREQRLATPSPKFKVADDHTPPKLRLVLLGSPCVPIEGR
jgi:hypothetical protein